MSFEKKLKNNKIDKKKFKKAFEYPFSFITYSFGDYIFSYNSKKDNFKEDENHWGYDIREIYRKMFNKNLKQENIDLDKINFPANINKIYWYSEGINDEKPWDLIAKINYGKKGHKYIYYTAWADYTGFDCRGGMTLYISGTLNRILKYAVPKKLIKVIKKDVM